MKRIFVIVLSFAVVQGVAFGATAGEKKNSTFTRPSTKKRVLVAFNVKDTKVKNLSGMTPEQIQANPQIAADLRRIERAEAVSNEPIPDDAVSGAL